MSCNCLADIFNCTKCLQNKCRGCDNKERYAIDLCSCDNDVCWTCKHDIGNTINCLHEAQGCSWCFICLECLENNGITYERCEYMHDYDNQYTEDEKRCPNTQCNRCHTIRKSSTNSEQSWCHYHRQHRKGINSPTCLSKCEDCHTCLKSDKDKYPEHWKKRCCEGTFCLSCRSRHVTQKTCYECKRDLCKICDRTFNQVGFSYVICSECIICKPPEKKLLNYVWKLLLTDVMKGPLYDNNVTELILGYN